jgi:hypothetical protein
MLLLGCHHASLAGLRWRVYGRTGGPASAARAGDSVGCADLTLAPQPAKHGKSSEVRAGRRDAANPDIDGDPSLARPVNILEVQQQGEFIDDERQPGACGNPLLEFVRPFITVALLH